MHKEVVQNIKENQTLLDICEDGYRVQVKNVDGMMVWYQNDTPILFSLGSEVCRLVKAAQISGVDNKILVGGLGFGNTCESAAVYGDVTVVELLNEAITFYLDYCPNPNFQIVNGDFKKYIEATNKKFDYILMQIDFPGHDLGYQYCVKQNAEMYTEKFLTTLSSCLSTDGVFVLEGVCEHNRPSRLERTLEKSGFTVTSTRKPFVENRANFTGSFDYMRFVCKRNIIINENTEESNGD